jgi:predicted ribosome quality control (RQC) complex YloA/Tae2 family protein
MQIQKPTLLDAARIAAELDQLRGAKIMRAWVEDFYKCIWMELTNPDIILRYMVEKQYVYLGIVEEIDSNAFKIASLLSNRELLNARQIGNDRIIQVNLMDEDRLGRKRESILFIELMPNHGNIVLTDQDSTIKWSLRDSSSNKYKLPLPLKKMTVLNLDDEKMISAIKNPNEIADNIYGLNARDVKNLQFDSFASIKEALVSLHSYVKRAATPGPAWLIFKDNEVIGYSLAEPVLDTGEKVHKVDSALKIYEKYYNLATAEDEEGSRLESLLKILLKEISYQKAKLIDIENALKAAENAGKFKLYGELILANISELTKGTKLAHLPNFDGQKAEFVDVALDPSISITTNAEEYFKKYKKAASSTKVLTRRLEALKQRIAVLETISDKHADDPESLKLELVKHNIIAVETEKPHKKQQPRRLPYRAFKSSTGWEILVGRSNKDNDELTFKIAAKDDYWFHAWQAAGSHTVLRLPNKSAIPDKQALLEAASLAAYFSKARTSSKVPVAYTQVKFVRKPKNFPPGKVLVEKEKQLMVRPANLDDFGEKKDL